MSRFFFGLTFLAEMNNTLIKGLRLLDIMARYSKPIGVSELAVMASMPKSGTHRLLQALVNERYVMRVPPASYVVSIKLWELGSAALWSFDLRRHADALMEALMQSTGESVHLSVLDGREVVYVHKLEGPNPIRAYSQIGSRSHAHCVATGKAMLAFRKMQWLTDIAHDLNAVTPRTITEPKKFLHEMQRVRRAGYAINRGEWRRGVNGLAAPIFEGTGTAIAAIGISGPDTRLRMARLRELATPVCEAAEKLSIGFGEIGPHASMLHAASHWNGLR